MQQLLHQSHQKLLTRLPMVLNSLLQSAACTQRSGLTAVAAVGSRHMLLLPVVSLAYVDVR